MPPALPLPLKTLNLFTPEQPDLVKKTISINNEPFHFFHPPNDDTMYGTLSCLQNDKFSLAKVRFAEGDTFVDIGSNIGLVGLLVAKLFPKINVFAFDASDLAVKAARSTAAANGLVNYQAYHKAIGAVNQSDIVFFSNGKDKSCLVENGLNKDNKVAEVKVDKIKIDEIFDSPLLNVGKVKYLKMDIEGGEFEIFDRLFTTRPDIIDRIEYLHLEVHPYQEFKPAELEEKVKSQWKDRVFFDT